MGKLPFILALVILLAGCAFTEESLHDRVHKDIFSDAFGFEPDDDDIVFAIKEVRPQQPVNSGASGYSEWKAEYDNLVTDETVFSVDQAQDDGSGETTGESSWFTTGDIFNDVQALNKQYEDSFAWSEVTVVVEATEEFTSYRVASLVFQLAAATADDNYVNVYGADETSYIAEEDETRVFTVTFDTGGVLVDPVALGVSIGG